MSYLRKVIRITALDSPNVRLALAEIKAGKEPSGRNIVPGVLSWREYQKRLTLWDNVRQCIGLMGEFYEGAEVLLFPPEWLNRAETIADSLSGATRNGQRIMGVDAAEGGDNSCWTVIDELGILSQVSLKTADTSDIPGRTIAMMKEWKVEAKNVLFDRGGGGKQHADVLRTKGYNVRTVGFGEAVSDPHAYKYRHLQSTGERLENIEERYVYRNRRAEMYGLTRQLLDPEINEKGFGIPANLVELRRQLSPIPLMYDAEGRLFLPPKNQTTANSTQPTLKSIIGHSPDEADSTVLAVFGLMVRPVTKVVGAVSLTR